MKVQGILVATVCLLLCLAGCAGPGQTETTSSGESHSAESTAPLDDADFQQESAGFAPTDQMTEPFTVSTPIQEVMDDPIFGRYGRLLFPVEDWYMSGDTLGELQLTWYNNIDPNETVEIVNTLWQRANAGETVFYDIYTEEEKAEDPDKEDTGLLFFKGDPGAKFAVCNAGGGFAYVGAMQDSFPHALEISKRGYNAFALIYRPGAQTACEDLARAISFIFEHAEELEVDTEGYSLWGGSAGARMAAWLGSYGPAVFGGDDLPQPSAVIMQYTGHSDYTENDPPTFACVGESDGIANWRTMQPISTEHLSGMGTMRPLRKMARLSIFLWQNMMSIMVPSGHGVLTTVSMMPMRKLDGARSRSAMFFRSRHQMTNGSLSGALPAIIMAVEMWFLGKMMF